MNKIRFLEISRDEFAAMEFENSNMSIRDVVNHIESGRTEFEDFDAKIVEFEGIQLTDEFLKWMSSFMDYDYLKTHNFYKL